MTLSGWVVSAMQLSVVTAAQPDHVQSKFVRIPAMVMSFYLQAATPTWLLHEPTNSQRRLYGTPRTAAARVALVGCSDSSTNPLRMSNVPCSFCLSHSLRVSPSIPVYSELSRFGYFTIGCVSRSARSVIAVLAEAITTTTMQAERFFGFIEGATGTLHGAQCTGGQSL